MSAYRAAEAPALGPLIADYRPRSLPRILVAILFILIGAFTLLGAVASPPHGVRHWLIVLVWGGLFPAAGLLALFGRKPDRVRIHELAVVIGDRVVPWDDVVAIRTHRYLSTRGRPIRPVLDRHYFSTRDGQLFEARCSMVDLDGLLAQLRARTLEPLVAAARLRLDAGETLTFGELTLTPDAVGSSGVSIPRASVESATFEGLDQNVTIKGKGSAWLEAPLKDVPNAHVLLALCSRP